MSTIILYVDLETTGLEPEGGNILEVAWRYEIDGVRYWHTQSMVVRLPSLCREDFDSEYVWSMHRDNGLVALCSGGAFNHTLAEIETIILEDLQMIEERFGPHDKVMLGGNSVSFDKSWIQEHMHELYKRVHYRIFDVRTLITFFELCGVDVKSPKIAHRAKDDLKESMRIVDLFRAVVAAPAEDIRKRNEIAEVMFTSFDQPFAMGAREWRAVADYVMGLLDLERRNAKV